MNTIVCLHDAIILYHNLLNVVLKIGYVETTYTISGFVAQIRAYSLDLSRNNSGGARATFYYLSEQMVFKEFE